MNKKKAKLALQAACRRKTGELLNGSTEYHHIWYTEAIYNAQKAESFFLAGASSYVLNVLFANKIWHTSENINRKIYIFYSGEIWGRKVGGEQRGKELSFYFSTVNTSAMKFPCFFLCMTERRESVYVR